MIPFLIKTVKHLLLLKLGVLIGIVVLGGFLYGRFLREYQSRVYPGISAEGYALAGQTKEEIIALFNQKSQPLQQSNFTLHYDEKTTTISGVLLNLRYDSSLAAQQALLLGRTDNWTANTAFKLQSFVNYLLNDPATFINLSAIMTYDTPVVDEKLDDIASQVLIEPVEPLFEFNQATNRVTAFRLGKPGRKLDRESAKQLLSTLFTKAEGKHYQVQLPLVTVDPKANTDDIAELGIVELLGKGESLYKGSIPGRVHNVVLAASRTTGILVAPGEVFSFNQIVGDISAATGYKSAYVIKSGRTILDDGGGVCQVSTTLFRAALNAGLEIVERKAHSYRVGYYEQGGFGPGLDATVFDPSVDLKIRNSTGHHILIQSRAEPGNYKLTFEIYGKDDGREVYLSDIRIKNQTPPPPPLYQDDPTLPPGTEKQVDFPAWGAKTEFDYKVVRDGEVLIANTFKSDFRPWQAVYLRGPGI
ncbi:VanW family protein [Candidatus Roizmanbacteria bacterium]|nr:VanW family protein [Candidatus Roizmanbacteria bacterium]